MQKTKFEERVRNNLMSFLCRVDLKGTEAIAWSEIFNIINKKEESDEYSIEKYQLENLLLFLKRATLTGEEVQSFLEIVDIIKQNIPASEKKDEDKEKISE